MLRLLTTLGELLYPHRCIICGRIVEIRGVCPDCLGIFDIRFIDVRIIDKPQIDALIVCTHYKDIKHILQKAKFERDCAGVLCLGRALTQVWQIWHSEYLCDVYGAQLNTAWAMCVPTDYKRRIERGYDVPELLFRDWLAQNNLPFYNILRRTRLTHRQFDLTRQERLRNVQESIELLGEVRGRDIVLLDDIFTTGASMNEAAGVLKRGGAKQVVAVAFASDI